MIPSNKICGTCLSQDRRLFKGSVGLKFICPEIKCTKYNMICWECKEYLRKYLRFKKQALRAQNLLLSHTCQNLITTCVSSLTIANVASISITHEIMNESDTYTAQNLVKTLKGKELDIKKEVEWLDEDMTEDQLANAHITSICSNVTSPFEMMVKREELDIKEEVKWADDVVDDMGTKDMMENQLASDMLSVEIENVNSPSENTVKREELYIKEEVKCPDEEFDDETKDMMKNQLAIDNSTPVIAAAIPPLTPIASPPIITMKLSSMPPLLQLIPKWKFPVSQITSPVLPTIPVIATIPVLPKGFSGQKTFDNHIQNHGKNVDNQIEYDVEWARKRKLANASMRRYRKKKQMALDKLNGMTEEMKKLARKQDEERRREAAKDRHKRYRRKKRIEAQKSKSEVPGPSQDPLLINNRKAASADTDSPKHSVYLNENTAESTIVDNERQNADNASDQRNPSKTPKNSKEEMEDSRNPKTNAASKKTNNQTL